MTGVDDTEALQSALPLFVDNYEAVPEALAVSILVPLLLLALLKLRDKLHDQDSNEE